MNRPLSPPLDYAGPRFVTDTHRAVSQFPDLYDSLQELRDTVERRRRAHIANRISTIVSIALAVFCILYFAAEFAR